MKRYSLLIILILVCSVILLGCVPNGGSNTDVAVSDGANDNHDNVENENANESSDNIGNENENEAPGDTGNTDSNENTGGNETEGSGDNSNDVTEGDENKPSAPVVGTRVGDLLRKLTLERVDGGTVSTSQKGKILILNIWATWCPPCKAELPDFNRIATEYKDDVVIIAAHTPSGNANAESYVNTNFPETDIIFAYDTIYSEAFIAAGGDQYIPHTAIVNQNGVIISSAAGILSHEELVSIIEGLLNQ